MSLMIIIMHFNTYCTVYLYIIWVHTCMFIHTVYKYIYTHYYTWFIYICMYMYPGIIRYTENMISLGYEQGTLIYQTDTVAWSSLRQKGSLYWKQIANTWRCTHPCTCTCTRTTTRAKRMLVLEALVDACWRTGLSDWQWN